MTCRCELRELPARERGAIADEVGHAPECPAWEPVRTVRDVFGNDDEGPRR